MAVEPAWLLLVARRAYADRRLREAHFGPGLFADPAWDILLDLYIARSEGKAVATLDACSGAAAPLTTGLRWLRVLEKEGLVKRSTDRADARRVFVELSDAAVERMEAVLTGMAVS